MGCEICTALCLFLLSVKDELNYWRYRIAYSRTLLTFSYLFMCSNPGTIFEKKYICFNFLYI